MATQTPNLNLVLPDYSDKADVSVLNDNFKKIDDFSGGGKVEEWLEDIQVKANESLKEIQTKATESLNEIENKANNALASIPDDYETIYSDVSALKDHKADAIIDTSARAAYHELHAQDGPMSVTLFGETTETGSGDKSPENPYVISGVNAPNVRAGGKNLLELISSSSKYATIGTDGKINISKESGNGSNAVFKTNKTLIDKGLKLVVRNDSGSSFVVKVRESGYINITPDKYAYSGETASIDLSAYAGKTIEDVYIRLTSGMTYEGTASLMLTYSDDTTFEPYNANVITPPLLPDGEPMYGNGTVDDIVENDVPSGCDRKITFAEGDDLTLANFDAAANVVYSDTTAGIVVTDGAITRTLTYPCTVFYRSTDYTPDKDIRATKVTRRWAHIELNGSEKWTKNETPTSNRFTTQLRGYKLASIKDNNTTPDMICNAYSPIPAISTYDNKEGISQTSGGIALHVYDADYADASIDAWGEHLAESPIIVVGKLDTPEVYMTDPYELRKPAHLIPVTVTGSSETAVEYPHDTKHYIDGKISELVTLALANN